MARITVEDCVEEIPDRFELVVLASKRTKDISFGAQSTIVQSKKDKNSVIALREIASGNLDIQSLRDSYISSLQKNNKLDQVVEESLFVENNESNNSETLNFADSDIFSSESDLSQDQIIDSDADISFDDNVIDDAK